VTGDDKRRDGAEVGRDARPRPVSDDERRRVEGGSTVQRVVRVDGRVVEVELADGTRIYAARNEQ
jgi:hypothetical protein